MKSGSSRLEGHLTQSRGSSFLGGCCFRIPLLTPCNTNPACYIESVQCPARPLVRCGARVVPLVLTTRPPTAARNPARSPSPHQTQNRHPTGFRNPAAEARGRGHAHPRERASSENKGLSAARRSPGSPARSGPGSHGRHGRSPARQLNLSRDAAREQSAS